MRPATPFLLLALAATTLGSFTMLVLAVISVALAAALDQDAPSVDSRRHVQQKAVKRHRQNGFILDAQHDFRSRIEACEDSQCRLSRPRQ